MSWKQRTLAVSFAVIAAASGTGQPPVVAMQQAMVIDSDDDFLMRGCVRPVDLFESTSPDILVWGRRNVMLTGLTALGSTAPDAVGTVGLPGRVFYWIEEDDDELSEYMGQMVEVRGDIEDFERADVDIHREGDFMVIDLDLHDRIERVRVPTLWLRGPNTDMNHGIDIIARRIDVDEVFVLGVGCNLR